MDSGRQTTAGVTRLPVERLPVERLPVEQVATECIENVEQVNQASHVEQVSQASHASPVATQSTSTRKKVVQRVRAGTVEFNVDSTVAVTPVNRQGDSSVPSHTGLTSAFPLTRSSDKASNIRIASALDPASYSLDHEDAPDPDYPDETEADADDASGVGEVDLLADPASWRPFPINSQLLRKDGRTIGFRTKSGIVFGPERIEIRPDASGQQWLFRFITHDYSVPMDLPTSRRSRATRVRHDLDAYL